MGLARFGIRRLQSLGFWNLNPGSKLFFRSPPKLKPSAIHLGDGLQLLEDRMMLSSLTFLEQQANLYNHSENPSDFEQPAIFMYTDFNAGGAYTEITATGGLPANGLDGNDPDAARGFSSFRMTTNAADGFFEFGMAKTNNSPREIPENGFVRRLRFWAKGDTAGQQLTVKLLKTELNGGFSFFVTQSITLSTAWKEYAVNLPASPKLTPGDVFSVQFQLPQIGTVRLDEVRLNTDGTDPLRLIQSYVPGGWAATNSADNTAEGRDVNIYPNRAFLYDIALAVKALIASDNPDLQSLALNQIDAMLASASNGKQGYFNQHYSGYVLLADGAPRAAATLDKTVGDNAWFGLSLLDAFRMTGDELYLARAREISDWIDNQLKAGGPLKGYFGGFDETGTKVSWRSTEHNIDAFELNHQIAEILTQRNETSSAQVFTARADWAASFVVSMFDAVDGNFWTGTTVGNTINKSSVPLDAQLWPLLTLKLSADYATALPWTDALTFAESNIVETDGAIQGFSFSTNSTADIVWSEGVGHGVAVYRSLGLNGKAQQGLNTLNLLVGPNDGIYAASSDTIFDPAFDKTFYDQREAVGPTAWQYLGSLKLNAFSDVVPGVFNPTSVNIYGTNRNDKITFTAGNQLSVLMISPAYTQLYKFDKTLSLPINLDALAGQDETTVQGGPGNETAKLSVESVEMSAAQYDFSAVDVERVLVRAGAGTDRANFFDSTGDDRFNGSPTSSLLTGPGLNHRANGFDRVYVYATAGGNDKSFLYDSTANDVFLAKPEFGQMSAASFFIKANGFDQVKAYSTAGGVDRADMYDSAGDDRFAGPPAYGQFTGIGFNNQANGFDRVNAFATLGGNDVARLYDSVFNDTFFGRQTNGRLSGNGFSNFVSGFDRVMAIALSGGTDTLDVKNVSYIFKQLGSWENVV